MFGVGVLYLLFEKSILVESNSTTDKLASPGLDSTSRVVLGGQVSSTCLYAPPLLTDTRSA
jgi:phosphatidylinositol glycan class N